MKKKLILGVLAVSVVLSGVLFGTQAMRNVFAAEEAVAISSDSMVNGMYKSMNQKILNVYKTEVFQEEGCTVVLPAGYLRSTEVEGLYLSERNPLDSSNIYYSVSGGIDSGELKKTLSDGSYKQQMQKKYEETYGNTFQLTEFSFKETKVSGAPAFELSVQGKFEEMTLEQLILIVTADQTYTVTYSQSADDERMSEFHDSVKSAGLILTGDAADKAEQASETEEEQVSAASEEEQEQSGEASEEESKEK